MIISWSEREIIYIYIHIIYIITQYTYIYMCVCVPYLSDISSACAIENSSVCPFQPGLKRSTMVHHGPPFQQQIEVGEAPVHLKSSFRWHTPVGSFGSQGIRAHASAVWHSHCDFGFVKKKVMPKNILPSQKQINPRGLWRISVSHFQTNLHEKLPW
jgi:hypothetical protein